MIRRLWRAWVQAWCPHPSGRTSLVCVDHPVDNGGVGRYRWGCYRCGWEGREFLTGSVDE